MFPEIFLINNKDIAFKLNSFYTVYSNCHNFKGHKVVLINRSDLFYEKTKSKIQNALAKRFQIKSEEIFEIKTNLKKFENKGRVKIEKINFEKFLQKFSENNLSQKMVKKFTSIGEGSVNIVGTASLNDGVTMIIFTDASLPKEAMSSLITNSPANPLKNIYLENNYPFLNSIIFFSQRINRNHAKIKNDKDISLKHFKKSLDEVLENLGEMILKEQTKEGKVCKIEVEMETKAQSIEVLRKIVCAKHIKSALKKIGDEQGYHLLRISMIDLFGNEEFEKLSFQINGTEVFKDAIKFKNDFAEGDSLIFKILQEQNNKPQKNADNYSKKLARISLIV